MIRFGTGLWSIWAAAGAMGAAGLPEGAVVEGLSVEPADVKLSGAGQYVQLVVTAELQSGDRVDVTRLVETAGIDGVASVSEFGRLDGIGDGGGELVLKLGERHASVPVAVTGANEKGEPDYIRDVMPVISKLGCNMGTCHGSKDGKAGFKLSLRGYDMLYDVRAFADDLGSRRVNRAAPDRSLMLLKATAAVPHEGGQLTKVGDRYYNIVRDWIAGGSKLDLDTPRVASIEVFPKNPVVQEIGAEQQVRVVATYADGVKKDVTSEAFVESGNIEVAKPSEDYTGLIRTLRRGEAPVLVRFEGQYAATTVTVMGNRDGFEWEEPPANNEIDRFVAAKLKRMKTSSSPICNDYDFVRRVYLDLTGLPPAPEKVRAFVEDKRDSRWKREKLIDELIGSPEFVDYWTNKWADLLQVNGKFLGREGATLFRDWIRKEVEANTPYDEFVRQIVTASGSNKENPPASYYKVLRTPEETMENTTHLFLATRFNCNKCHDHPFERWTQDNYYEMTAYFARVGLKKDDASGDKKIGGTAVEGAKPLYEVVFEKADGETTHERTGEVTAPAFPYAAEHGAKEASSRREALAAWITSPDNQYFASSYVNRVWGYLTGTGLIEPIDDIRAGNPPTNPELLKWLTDGFVESGFDVRKLMRTICQSRTYQLSIESNRWNEDDEINYSHAKARRLPAEVLYDSIYATTGSQAKIPGVPAGTRAAALPDVGVKLADGFLGNLGRPVRESACECERSSELQLGPVMALISGPTVGNALSDGNSEVAKLAKSEIGDEALVEELFMRILNRPAQEKELNLAAEMMRDLPGEHARLVEELAGYEKEIAPSEEKRMAEYEGVIADAKGELERYEAEIAEREAELDRKHAENLAKVKGEFVSYQQALAPKLAEWEKQNAEAIDWTPLTLANLKATAGSELQVMEDGSVFVSGKNGKGEYEFTADTDLTGITAVRLEALPDDRLPMKGPGRADSGNFVLNEIELFATPKAGENPKEAKMTFQRALADFSQGGYEVAKAIDGKQKDANDNGWAVHPKVGEKRVAVFELKGNVGTEGGSTLRFKLFQHYTDATHSLGRFRVSVTRAQRPVSFGLPDEIKAIFKVAAEERNDEQVKKLSQFFYDGDAGWKERQKKVGEAEKPRPVDAGLKERREQLAKVSEPFKVDPKLGRLRADVKLSEAQLKQQRLIAAQDIAWALINTPGFLFNR